MGVPKVSTESMSNSYTADCTYVEHFIKKMK